MWIYWKFWLRHMLIQAISCCIAWTVFKCIHPFLPGRVLGVLLGGSLCSLLYIIIAGLFMILFLAYFGKDIVALGTGISTFVLIFKGVKKNSNGRQLAQIEYAVVALN